MRWSTYRVAGVERAAVWRDDRLYPTPDGAGLVDLLGDDGTRLRAAAVAAVDGPGVDPADVTLLPPVPRPPSIRDFMAFEEHVVTSFSAIGMTVDPVWYEHARLLLHQPEPPCAAAPTTCRWRREAATSTTSWRSPP